VKGSSKALIAQAIDALKAGDRKTAVALFERELREGSGSAASLRTILKVASHISEIDLAIKTALRISADGSIQSLLEYWTTLSSFGRSPEAAAEIRRQPVRVRDHPSVLYLRGKSAAEWGRFEEAEELFRRSLAKAPALTAAWLALATIKSFHPGDPDIAAMERLERQLHQHPHARATLCFALGKAREDCGDPDDAFAYYAAGAAIRRREQERFDSQQVGRAADEAIAGYTPQNLQRLLRSNAVGQRSLFVTGLPRSGTTLTEQILRGHSAVAAGAEVNLFGASILAVLGLRIEDALAYQKRADSDDPWGDIAREYNRLLNMRFPAADLVVDKSLGQAQLIGLMLHALPHARIAWLRRAPEDVALSCFRTQFDSGLSWTWSLVDIADYMRIEDRLFEHWRALFAERIIVVPYEDLVGDPASWARRLQEHFGLNVEERIEQVSRADRFVETASISQVREPITASFVGRASAFERHLKPFRERYYG
jgi:tetratricopeptide (TPR) repeat protein